MIGYEQLQKGIINPLASAKKMTREDEEQYLYEMFYAQLPRLKDKIEDVVTLEKVIFNILEDKYNLRPQMARLCTENPAEYRKAYNTAIKVHDLIGRDLGRLGLTKRPQAYIPVGEKQTFDPKASATLREKAKGLSDALKDEDV